MRRAIAIAVLGVALFIASLASVYYGGTTNHIETRILIPKGASLRAVAGILESEGVFQNEIVFELLGRLAGRATQIHAGEYDVAAHLPLRELFAKFVRGDVVLHPLTIAEGLSSEQVVAQLASAEFLRGSVATPAEGSLLPETYHFARGTTRSEAVAAMQAAHQKLLAQLWAGRGENLSIATKHEAVVLASIVEKETGKAGERGLVSGVFHNRLRRGMRLQSDPTIIYGLVGGGTLGRKIRRSEINRATPYNTYQIDGLPPTPITNAGRAALYATLHPAATEYLYFVSDAKGGHRFATTLKEHRANVKIYREEIK